jgi:hypothetical protein
MTTIVYLLASALPASFWALRAIVLRNISVKAKLLADLLLLILSVPLAIEFIGRAMNFPVDAGDHNPGVGVVFVPLALVWLLCVSIWLVRAQIFAIRRERGRRLGVGAATPGTPTPPHR